jgi:RNA polymerase sigma factor (sigma-70 family)
MRLTLPLYMQIKLLRYTDTELVTAASTGDHKAAEVLFTRHTGFVMRLVKQLGRSAAEAEDAAQDIWAIVWEHLPQFKQQSSFTTWLYRITVNHILQQLRREKYQHRQQSLAVAEDTIPEETIFPDDLLNDYFTGVLLCLSEAQRTTLVLADIFRMDHHAAAQVLKLTPDNYRQRLSRSRKDLRNWMAGKCSLVTPGRTCQCPRKKQCFIDEGRVNAQTGKFETAHIRKVREYIATQLQAADYAAILQVNTNVQRH